MSQARSLLVLIACLIALAVGAGCDKDETKGTVLKREGEPDYVRGTHDATMKRAIQKALATHKTFIAALQNPKPSHRGFAVKKPFLTPDGGQEHIWIGNLKWDGTQFRGTINNEPVDTKTVTLGQTVTVQPHELSDWMYIDGKKLVGGYTVRVIHFQSSAEEQRKFTRETGMEVPPIDF